MDNAGKFQVAPKGKAKSAPDQAERAGRDDIVHSFTRQTLKNLEAYIWRLHTDKKNLSESISFIPIIVTNSKLYSIEITSEQIKPNSDLRDFQNCKQEKYVAYNFSTSVKWDDEKQEIRTASGGFEKTVFVVNIHHLTEFVDCIKKGFTR